VKRRFVVKRRASVGQRPLSTPFALAALKSTSGLSISQNARYAGSLSTRIVR